MSISLTVQCFEDGDVSRFPRGVVWEAFAPYASQAAISGWDLAFPDGSTSHLSLDDDELVNGFGISRPSGQVLFDAVYSVLSKAPTIMIMSTDGACCVASQCVVSGIPGWLLKALPAPTVVGSGGAIMEFLSRGG